MEHDRSRTQIVPRSIDALSRRPVLHRLRSILQIFADIGTSAVRHLFSLAGLKLLAKAIGAAAICLVGIGIFWGARGWPGDDARRLDAIELAMKRLETRIAAPGVSRTEVAHPTTILVAIQFVTAAAERSTPFDTALAVAISMTGDHPKIGPLLDKLLVEAPAGVPSLEDLRREFRAKLEEFERAGLFMGIGMSSSAYGLTRFLGLAGPQVSAEHQATLKKISEDVAGQHIGQAVQLLLKLDGPLREGLEGWREKMERRVAVDLILAELRRAAFIDLIDEAS